MKHLVRLALILLNACAALMAFSFALSVSVLLSFNRCVAAANASLACHKTSQKQQMELAKGMTRQ